MMRIGPYELHAIETGRFRLDGGAMFGVVPKVLWEKQAPPDAQNRIALSMRSLLAIDRGAGKIILVDTGAGQKWSDDEIQRFAFEIEEDRLGAGLSGLGVSDSDVTDVIVTHLHFDHNGGLTYWADGQMDLVRPRFVKARHWIMEKHLAHALSPTPKDRASFYERDFKAILETGMFEVLGGENPACPFSNMSWFISSGHSPYQLLPRFFDENNIMQFMGDLVPTAAHLPVPWVMAYDNQPLRTIEEKQKILRDCQEKDLILFFEHDPHVAVARIDVSGKRPQIKESLIL